MAKKKSLEAATTADDKDKDFVRKAIAKYERSYQKEQTNITLALEDLEFRVGEQWPSETKRERERDYRPALTVNKIPTFVRQITGDIRLMRPSIKVVPVDSRGDPDTAEVLAGLVRYVENRSDAQHAYATGADSQVVAGIGHWRVLTEYADDSTFDQEIRITSVADGVGVIWDADAILPNKEDAKFCFVPVDLSHEDYKERYPDSPIDDFTLTLEGRTSILDEWFGDDFVRVAEYWERRPEKRTLALLPDGAIDDVTDQPERLAELKAQGVRIEERESHRVYRSVISSCHLLEEPKPWPGRLIPIVPVIGEEVVCGRRTFRHGIVRYLKDPQRAYNYFRSAETEAVALQPKAPWLVTEKNIEDNEDQWLTANTRNYPYLLYKSDPKNGNAVPQRVSARMDTSGMVEGLQISASEMQEVTGIYNAALGARSNETSGTAIKERTRQADVGSYVYVENFSRAIKHTGRIILDLIPAIYDSERTIRITGEDGKVNVVDINQQVALDHVMNDVTVAAYDVVLDQGPSYATKREEAREGMLTFLQQAPSAAPVVLDLIANAQDWPNADKFAERMKTLLPPNIQAMEAEESGEPPPPPPPPSPEQQAAQMELQFEQAKGQAEMQKAQLSVKEKEMDLQIKAMEMRQFEPNEQLIQMLGSMQQSIEGVGQVLGAMLEQINSPKQIIRGPDGRAVGVESNGQVRQLHRDANGRVATIQ
jgi:hypothetical protein